MGRHKSTFFYFYFFFIFCYSIFNIDQCFRFNIKRFISIKAIVGNSIMEMFLSFSLSFMFFENERICDSFRGIQNIWFNCRDSDKCGGVRRVLPHLKLAVNGAGSPATGSRPRSKVDQATQTPENIARETRNFTLRALKLQLNVTPNTLNLRYRVLSRERERKTVDIPRVKNPTSFPFKIDVLSGSWRDDRRRDPWPRTRSRRSRRRARSWAWCSSRSSCAGRHSFC